MEAHRIEKPNRNVLQEVAFADVDKAVERVLRSAIPIFGTKAAVCQASLLNVTARPYALAARWYGLGEGFKIKPEWLEYFEGKKLLSRNTKPSSLLWEVIESELNPGRRLPRWLKQCSVRSIISDPPPNLTNYYIAHIQAAPRNRPINIVCRSDNPDHDVPYETSVIVPIIIQPPRGHTNAKPILCGVCSIDSSRLYEDVIERRENLALMCAQVGLLSSLIESLDLAFYDYLAGDEGVLSQAFYYKKIASVRDHHNLGLLFCDLNNFKAINDENDHDMGDEVIRRFGAALVARSKAHEPCIRESWVCRFGGDEFGLLFICDEGQIESLKDWALKLVGEGIRCPDNCKQRQVFASGGVATWPKIKPKSATGLKVCADWAMYAAKRIRKEIGEPKIVCWDTARPEIEALRTNEALKLLAKHSWSVKINGHNGPAAHTAVSGH